MDGAFYEFNFCCVQFGLNVFFWETAAAESISCWLYEFLFSWNYLLVSRSRNLFSLKTSLGSGAGFSFCIQCYLGTSVVPCLRQIPCGKQKAYVRICVAFYEQQESYICGLCRRLQCILQVYQLTFIFFTKFVSYAVILRAYVPVFLRRKIDFLFLYLLSLLKRTATMTKVSNPGVFRRKMSNLYFIKFSCTHELNEDINFEYRTLKSLLKYCKYWCACTRISLYSWIIYVENFRHNATGGILYVNLTLVLIDCSVFIIQQYKARVNIDRKKNYDSFYPTLRMVFIVDTVVDPLSYINPSSHPDTCV